MTISFETPTLVNQVLLLSGMAGTAFVSTNLDDLFLLIALMSHPLYRFKEVVIGQLLGMIVIVGTSFVATLLFFSIPNTYLKLFGLLPIGIGLAKLLQRSKVNEIDENLPDQKPGYRQILTVALITLANGGDNFGIYIPLFSSRAVSERIFLMLFFFGMTFFWCGLSYYLVHHPGFQKPIRKYGTSLLPWVLVFLGLFIIRG